MDGECWWVEVERAGPLVLKGTRGSGSHVSSKGTESVPARSADIAQHRASSAACVSASVFLGVHPLASQGFRGQLHHRGR